MFKRKETGKPKAQPESALSVEAAVPYLEVPRDDEYRFAQSYAPVGEEVAARAFFEEYGFCVFRDVLTPQETEATRHEILRYIERQAAGFDPTDDSTWGEWKSKQFGMPGMDPAAWWQPQLARNRRHPHVAAGFAQLLGCAPASLRCNHDRWALYRLGVKTRRNIHLDINPRAYVHCHAAVSAERAQNAYAVADDLFAGRETNLVSAAEGPHLQGTITMLPNLEHDAGFLCVPGSHRYFDAWAERLGAEAEEPLRHSYPEHSPLYEKAQRVPVAEGSLIVWDVRLAHGSAPDQSHRGASCRPRFVQFVTLRSARTYDDKQAAKREDLVHRLFAAHGLDEPTCPLQRAVAGLPAAAATQVEAEVATGL